MNPRPGVPARIPGRKRKTTFVEILPESPKENGAFLGKTENHATKAGIRLTNGEKLYTMNAWALPRSAME